MGLSPVGDPGSDTELSVAPGTKIVLYWQVSGDFDSVCIGDEPVPKAVMSKGHLEMTPTESSADADGKITYTLTANPKDTTQSAVTATVTVSLAQQPSVDKFEGAPKEDDGLTHLPDSLQVVVETPIVLNWEVSNAPDGVELSGPDGPQTFDANTTSTEVTPKEDTQDYELVAIAGSARSEAKTVHVSTHPHGHVYSTHAQVLPPGAPAKIEKFAVYASDGGTLDNASDTAAVASGAKVKLHVEVSGEVDSISIDNDAGDVTLGDDGIGEVEVEAKFADGATETLYTLTVKPSNPNEDDQTATVHVTQQAEELSATLEFESGGVDASSDAPGTDALEPLTLKWKVTGAKSATLAAENKPGDPVITGTTEEGGRLRLAIDPQSALPNILTMKDGDNDVVWEFELTAPSRDANPAQPEAAGDSSTVSFAALLEHGIDLTVDDSGNGAGTLVVDPGPDTSITLLLSVLPKDSSKDPVMKELTAKVTNFDVLLMLDEKNSPPAGKECTFEVGKLAANDAATSTPGTDASDESAPS